MRVLDLGCHDGFVSAWLRDRYDGDLEIDGLELMPDAACRAMERGIRCKVGPAEAAPDLFDRESYDAVLLFEVIEHVPDVDRLLSAAEAMVKPDGRIYVSTPNGTFGTGNNPHHLRVYRAQDLADLLRRRGRLHEMTDGMQLPDGTFYRDGTVSASYTPSKRLGEVAIFCGPCWQRWSPADIATKGLGGSETAAVRLAEQLSERGYIVTVYGDVDQCAWRDVIFRDWRTFDPMEPRQCVISSRMPQLFDRRIRAARKVLWMHDTDCGDELTPARAGRIDSIVTLSDWHRRHVTGRYPFAAQKVVQSRNGIALGLFDPGLTMGDRCPRVVYTSSPDRGLDILLELWPRIRARVPEAEFWWCYSPVYWEVAKQRPEVGAHADLVRRLSKQDGVVAIGSLPQPELAKLMLDSLVWCAPSWNTPNGQPFHETSCIGALEAQAAGCLVVASNWGALPETVRWGRLVDRTSEGQWRDAFVEHIVEGLTDTAVQAKAQERGPEEMASMGWEGVAADFVALFDPEGAIVG